MNRIRVMHVTDTLDAGGAERVAVNLANLLPRDRYQAYLCTTRRDGMLSDLVANDVSWLRLARQKRFDVGAVRRLCKHLSQQQIDILHAHGTSLFIAAFASLFPPYSAVVWHDHYGRYRFDDRPVWLYRLAAGRVCRVIAVNSALAKWAQARLRVSEQNIEYIPNFVCEPGSTKPVTSSGTSSPGARIVCVANFRPEKDHLTLIRAFAIAIRQHPTAHLSLIGSESDSRYLARVRREVLDKGLAEHVSFLGSRRDVPEILKTSDVAVLSSESEGLPLALLEYGRAGLPVVATSVGQCAEVLDDGRVGLLVSPGEPEKLASALLSLLNSPSMRTALGKEFRQRVHTAYSPEAAVRRVCSIYEGIMRSKGKHL